MGHKVHPIGIRLGIAKDWNSTWYAEKGEYATVLFENGARESDFTPRRPRELVA